MKTPFFLQQGQVGSNFLFKDHPLQATLAMATNNSLTCVPFRQIACSAFLGMNATTVYLLVELHLTPVKHLEILQMIIPSQGGEGGSPCCLLWQGRDFSPRSLEQIYTQGQTRWLPRTANWSGDTDSMHDLDKVEKHPACYRGWGGRVRNKHK